MNTYRVTMNRVADHQYAAFIVLARSEEGAIALLKQQFPPTEHGYIPADWDGGYEVRRVDNRDTEVIALGQFYVNAPGRAEP
jgi:hypothetical protein